MGLVSNVQEARRRSLAFMLVVCAATHVLLCKDAHSVANPEVRLNPGSMSAKVRCQPDLQKERGYSSSSSQRVANPERVQDQEAESRIRPIWLRWTPTRLERAADPACSVARSCHSNQNRRQDTCGRDGPIPCLPSQSSKRSHTCRRARVQDAPCLSRGSIGHSPAWCETGTPEFPTAAPRKRTTLRMQAPRQQRQVRTTCGRCERP